MRFEHLLAILSKQVEERFQSLPEPLPGPRGLRGHRGIPGEDGRGFVFSEHEPSIREMVKDFALKFTDLTSDQIESLRGPRGEKGDRGKSFIFDEHAETIREILSDEILNHQDKFKLKFEDLTPDDRLLLKGPRGQRGRAGKDFVFEEHLEFFNGLKLKFSDLSGEEKEELKLKFSNLTAEEKSSLKLRFEDLTDEEKGSLKGPRGQRGKTGVGVQGEKGDSGPKGEDGKSIRGLPGPIGLRGLTGRDGSDGVDGLDAPFVTEIEVVERDTQFYFVFHFSNGTSLETNSVDLPKGSRAPGFFISSGIGGGNGGSGEPGADGKSAYQIWIEAGNVGTEQDFLDSLIGPVGPQGPQGEIGPQGPPGTGGSANELIENIPCDASVFVGAAVRMEIDARVEYTMADWSSLVILSSLNAGTYTSVAVNALADAYENSNVIGLVESKSGPNLCNIRITGVTAPNYLGLEVTEEYYLSDLYPGVIVKSADAPQDPGTVLVRIGQPVGYDKMLYVRGERLVRA